MTKAADQPAALPRHPRGPRTVPRVALTNEEIIAAGLRLTASRGLAGWSTRELAAEVGCWPTAIVHRIGNRFEVERAIVDAVLRQVPLPDPTLTWRPWYSALLIALRQPLLNHPGVAHWLSTGALTIPTAITMIDIGVTKMIEAGLEDDAVLAHSVLLGTAVHLIDNLDQREKSAQLRQAIDCGMAELAHSVDHPGASRMAHQLLAGMTSEDFYHYAIERSLDGIAARAVSPP